MVEELQDSVDWEEQVQKADAQHGEGVDGKSVAELGVEDHLAGGF